jgi:hypothetical protein
MSQRPRGSRGHRKGHPMSAEAPNQIIEMEPDKLRITPLESDLVDDLVNRRLARLGGHAHQHRRELLAQMKTLGLRELQREEGIEC